MSLQSFHLFSRFEGVLSIGFFAKGTSEKVGQERSCPTFSHTYEGITEELGAHAFARLNQVHGNRTVRVAAPTNATVDADGMISDASGLALCITCADCQGFVVYAPKRHVIGALHVGWRGLIAGAIEEFFRTLWAEFSIAVDETFVAAGPSLCTACAQFSDPTRELPSLDPKFIHGKNIDLRAAAQDRLESCGVRADHFERHSDCTRCLRVRYWTYRGGDQLSSHAVHTNVFAVALRQG